MKRFFNMVEVVLALGIVAVGIMGIMAIIPVCLKSANLATADSYVTDLASSYFAEIEADPTLASGILTTQSAIVQTDFPPDFGNTTDDAGLPIFYHTGSSNASPGYAIVGFKTSRQRPDEASAKDEIDFTADRRVWKAFPVLFGNSTLNSESSPYLVRVYLEYSWPIALKYEDREKRLFVREFQVQSLPLQE